MADLLCLGGTGMQTMSKSSITIDAQGKDELQNPHPGVILKEEFLDEIGLSQNQLAQAIGVPGNRIHAIVNGTRSITADTDLRLCRFFRVSDGYFLRLQNAFDTLEAKRRISKQVAKIKPYDGPQAA
jgi:antitoxin HigA-1